VNICDVLGCEHCLSGEDGAFLIGQPVPVSHVDRLWRCPSCRAKLRADDFVSVGIPMMTKAISCTLSRSLID
jgi:hypothetical protein